MAYNANCPLATDSLDQSQADLLANFQALESFGYGYADMANIGTAPTFAAGNNGIYNLLDGTTSNNELYIHRQTVDAPTDFPATGCKMSNTAVASCDNGWAYTASGLLIKWGRSALLTTAGFNAVDVAALSGGPAFTRAFQVTATIYNTGAIKNSTLELTSFNSTTGSFSAGISVANLYVNYLVIGV